LADWKFTGLVIIFVNVQTFKLSNCNFYGLQYQQKIRTTRETKRNMSVTSFLPHLVQEYHLHVPSLSIVTNFYWFSQISKFPPFRLAKFLRITHQPFLFLYSLTHHIFLAPFSRTQQAFVTANCGLLARACKQGQQQKIARVRSRSFLACSIFCKHWPSATWFLRFFSC
jgi:hypothetical protein